jgi:hypothetical protein
MASINLQGDTSGSISISAPSVAGSNTLTLPKTTQTLATENALGVRNLIINGDMRIAQRGTSATGKTTGGYLTIDRFDADIASGGTWSLSQSTEVPSSQGFTKSYKFDCTATKATLDAGSKVAVQTKLEGQMVQHLQYGSSNAQTVTLSFWVRSSKTGTYTLEYYLNHDNRHYSKTYTIDTADTWEKKTITIAGDTTGVVDNDNTSGLLVKWWLAAGSTFTGGTFTDGTWQTRVTNQAVSSSNVNIADSTSNDWYLTGVQLEVSDTATPFEHRPWDMELERCKRYYQKSYEYGTAPGTATDIGRINMGGNNAGATASYLMGPQILLFPEMRATPTMYGYDGGGVVNKISRIQLSLADVGNNAISIVNQSTKGCVTFSASGTSRSGAGCHFTADAEL